jgi:hypothetical protein
VLFSVQHPIAILPFQWLSPGKYKVRYFSDRGKEQIESQDRSCEISINIYTKYQAPATVADIVDKQPARGT